VRRALAIVDCLPPHRRRRAGPLTSTTMVWPSVAVGFLVLGILVAIVCWALFASLW